MCSISMAPKIGTAPYGYRPLVVWLAFWLGVLGSGSLKAQEPVYKIYSHENGLESNDVLDISQDNLGYLWILNADGLTRFDGTEFKHTELPPHAYRRMYQDHLGRVWVYGNALHSYPDRLLYCYNGTVHEYEFNHILDSLVTIIRDVVVDKEGALWLGLRTKAKDSKPNFLKLSTEGEMELQYFTDTINNKVLLVKQVDGQYLEARKSGWYNTGGTTELHVMKPEDTSVVHVPSIRGLDVLSLEGRLFCVSRYEGIFEVVGNEVRKASELSGLSYPSAILDRSGRFLVPAMNHGLYYFKSLVLGQEPIEVLKEAHFSALFQSRDGSYWLGTRDQGIFHVPVFDLEVFDEKMGLPVDMVTNVESSDSVLWITYRSHMSRVHLEENESAPRNYFFGGILWSSHLYNDSLMFIGGQYDVRIPREFPYEVLVWPGVTEVKRPLASGKLSWCSGHALHTWYGEHINNRRHDFLVGDFVKSHIQIGAKHFLYSDLNGLKRYDNEVITPMEQYDTLLSKAIHGIESIDPRWMLLASTSYGILAMKDTSDVQVFGKKQGLSDDRCKKLVLESDSTFWVVTASGLDRVKFKAFEDSVSFEVLWQMGSGYGLSYTDAIQIEVDKESVWLAFRNEVIRIPKNMFQKRAAPLPPIVQHVYHEGKRVVLSEHSHTYSSGITEFEITSPYFTSPEEIHYKYRLVEKDSTWKSTKNRRVSFDAIGPGNHELEIVALDGQGVSSLPMRYAFTIDPVLWQTRTFKLTLSFIFLGLMAFVAYRQQQEKKRKRRLVSEIKTYKNTALRLQMNPHFVYNSLGSIQSFVLKEESRVSSKYIAKLSRLMRMIFDHNNRELITLEEELGVLRLYADLEFLRHDQELKFEIDIHSAVNPQHVLLPPMLLQPLIENAILHGLLGKKGVGIVSLSVKGEENGLIFTVADNGKGKAAKAQNKGTSRKSGGIITADRIALFNQQNGYDGFFELDEKSSLGTQIVFSIARIQVETTDLKTIPV